MNNILCIIENENSSKKLSYQLILSANYTYSQLQPLRSSDILYHFEGLVTRQKWQAINVNTT